MFGDNRIVNAIEQQKVNIEERLKSKKTTKAALEQLNRSLDMTFEEHAKFQEEKSLAQSLGAITHEEATSIYSALGESADHFNRQPLEVKAVVTKALAELMEARLGAVNR